MVYVPVATTGYMVYGDTVNINLIQNFTDGPLLIVIQVRTAAATPATVARHGKSNNVNRLRVYIYRDVQPYGYLRGGTMLLANKGCQVCRGCVE